MKKNSSVSLSGKAGDVTSIDDVVRSTERAVDQPPAEALLATDAKRNYKGESALRELRTLFGAMIKAPAARRIFLIIAATVFVLVLNVIGEIRMNKWQGSFFRAVEQKKLGDVWHQAGNFVVIMLVLLSFVVTQNWLLERMKIRLREWLTGHLLDSWMAPGRAYRLNMTSAERLNPDQRIQEDVRNFSEMSGDLGMHSLRSLLMLVSFVGVLWGMSNGVTLPFLGMGEDFQIPGYMVWFALFYAALGSWAAASVGRPLIDLNEERYTNEANLRYSLVRVSDNAESISFYHGERDERGIVNKSLQNVLNTLRTLSFANARLTWIACGHGWMVVILPVLVALPGYLQGKLDFGGLMMVVGAFNQVQQSLRWFVENFGRIADWRASLHRVMAFRAAVQTVDDQTSAAGYIKLTQHDKEEIEFDGTSISLLDGEVVIADATAKVVPGERVLLVGESGSGKSTLFRAAGGLWPWGAGEIKLPPKDEIMFLPQKPYIPLGTLAEALAYPNSAKANERGLMEAALERVNLESFIPMLDEKARWDKLMSLGQQQRLAFARLCVHRPKWVFLDEATSALDDYNQEIVMSLFTDELKESALLSIGHRAGLEEYHTRKLHLHHTEEGRVLKRNPPPKPAPRKKIRTRVKEKRKAAVSGTGA